MLIGFVLLFTLFTAEPMQVNERIYPNKATCNQIINIRPKEGL